MVPMIDKNPLLKCKCTENNMCNKFAPDQDHDEGYCYTEKKGSCYIAFTSSTFSDHYEENLHITYGCHTKLNSMIACNGRFNEFNASNPMNCCNSENFCNENFNSSKVLQSFNKMKTSSFKSISVPSFPSHHNPKLNSDRFSSYPKDFPTIIGVVLFLVVILIFGVFGICFSMIYKKKFCIKRNVFTKQSLEIPNSSYNNEVMQISSCASASTNLCHSSNTGSKRMSYLSGKFSVLNIRTLGFNVQLIRMLQKSILMENWIAERTDKKIRVSIYDQNSFQSLSAWHRISQLSRLIPIRNEFIDSLYGLDWITNSSDSKPISIGRIYKKGDLKSLISNTKWDQNIFDDPTEIIMILLKLLNSITSGLSYLHSDIIGTRGKPGLAHRILSTETVFIGDDWNCIISDLHLAITRLTSSDIDRISLLKLFNDYQNFIESDGNLEDRIKLDSQFRFLLNCGIEDPPLWWPVLGLYAATPRFSSHEILSGKLDAFSLESNQACDIYALGLILYEILNWILIFPFLSTPSTLPVYESELISSFNNSECSREKMQNLLLNKRIRPNLVIVLKKLEYQTEKYPVISKILYELSNIQDLFYYRNINSQYQNGTLASSISGENSIMTQTTNSSLPLLSNEAAKYQPVDSLTTCQKEFVKIIVTVFTLIQECIHSEATQRPTILRIQKTISELFNSQQENDSVQQFYEDPFPTGFKHLI